MNKQISYDSYKECRILGVEKKPIHWVNSKWRYVTNVLTDYTANGSFKGLADNVQYLSEPDYARLIRLTDLRANLKNDNAIYVNEKSFNYLKKSSLVGGEFLIANVGAHAGLVVQMPKNKGLATLGPNMMMARFNQDAVCTEFMVYVANSAYIQSQLTLKATASSAQPKLNKEDFRSVEFLLPSMEEQRKIVKFLTAKVNKVDELIKDKEKLIKLLEEKRQSMITETVTKGLNPNVKMKDSGVDWIGEIPKQWKTRKIKYLVTRENRPVKKEYEVITAFRDGQVTLRKNRREEGFTFSIKEIGYQGINKGDLVVHQMDAFAGAIGVSDSEGKASPVYNVCSPKNVSEIYIPYLCEVIRVMSSSGYIQSLAKGIRERSSDFRWNDMGNLISLLPPYEEQRSIMEFIDDQRSSTNKLITDIRCALVKLKEYRQSLIYEVVTGRIDVREFEVEG